MGELRVMIIAIDGYEANEKERVGIGRYAFEILRYLYLLNLVHHSYRIYLPSAPLSDMPPETPWWRYRVISPKRFWTFFRLPLALATDQPKADVVFSPTHYIPRFTNTPRVMSIMDLSYLHYRELFRPKDLHQLVHWTAYGVARAAKIMTISEFTKNAIIKAYGVPSNKVVVTYPGLSNHKSQITMTKQNLTRKYHLSDHYILSVGTLQPRKNYVRLIEAFSKFLKENKQKFGSIDLVIVGKRGWIYEDILAAPARYGVAGRVKFLDFVPDQELAVLYKNALCFVTASLYEGFGLPALEAMAYSVPVVVSGVSSLPEIVGKAGIYVDPNDTTSIAEGLLTAVRQRNFIQGKVRIRAGLEQVNKFTWENAAKKTLEVLEEVGGNK